MACRLEAEYLLSLVHETGRLVDNCPTGDGVVSLILDQINKMDNIASVGAFFFGDSTSVRRLGRQGRIPLDPSELTVDEIGHLRTGRPLFCSRQELSRLAGDSVSNPLIGFGGHFPLIVDDGLIGCIQIGFTGAEPPPACLTALELMTRELSRRLADFFNQGAARPGQGEWSRFEDSAMVLENIRESVVAADLSGIVQFWNQGAERLYGYSREEAVGRSVSDLIVEPESAQAEEDRMKQVFLKGYWAGQYPQKRKDGSLFWADAFISLLKDRNGKAFGLLGVDRDITDQKNMEKELIETWRTLRLLLDANPASMFLLRPDGQVVAANKKMADALGIELSDTVGRNVYDLIPPELRRSRGRKVERALATGKPLVFEDAGDGIFWEHHLHPVVDEQGRVIYLAITAIDLTERRKREELFGQMAWKLNKSQKIEALGMMAGGIAHSFNNILWGILGFAEMTLKELPAGGSAYENVTNIILASNRAKDLVDQILTYSRRAGTEKEFVSLSRTVLEAVRFMKEAFPRSMKMDCSLPDHICSVLGSPSQIHQVLLSICNNARQAMNDSGVIRISLAPVCLLPGRYQMEAGAEKRSYARLTVADAGGGIDPADLDRIFDPFFTTKKPGEGTGLGLSVVHGIVADHQGFVEAENLPEGGAIFIIHLPLAEGNSEKQDRQTAPIPGGDERILFIDDEIMLVQMVTRFLDKLGYDVVSRMDPEEAFADFETDPDGYDLVIVDYVMPVMNGYELAEKIRNLRRDIPIILCTGNIQALPEDERPDLFCHVLAKPISVHEAGDIIRKVLDGEK